MVSGFFIMILTKQDAQYASQVFIDYYKNFGRIDDYLRKVKLERMEDMPTPLFGYGPEDEMFQDFTMHPKDMQFVCREMPNDLYDNYSIKIENIVSKYGYDSFKIYSIDKTSNKETKLINGIISDAEGINLYSMIYIHICLRTF